MTMIPEGRNDNITESWLCVDCGFNTAPDETGKSPMRLSSDNEVYTVRNSIWAKAGMEPFGGCLCVGCLEKRLGRRLRPKDFKRDHVFNQPYFPRSKRLHDRLWRA
jgi:hypothetical protein